MAIYVIYSFKKEIFMNLFPNQTNEATQFQANPMHFRRAFLSFARFYHSAFSFHVKNCLCIFHFEIDL